MGKEDKGQVIHTNKVVSQPPITGFAEAVDKAVAERAKEISRRLAEEAAERAQNKAEGKWYRD